MLSFFGAMREHTKKSKKNVYQQVSATTTLQEDTERRKENGEDDLDNVAARRISMKFRGEGATLSALPSSERHRETS